MTKIVVSLFKDKIRNEKKGKKKKEGKKDYNCVNY